MDNHIGIMNGFIITENEINDKSIFIPWSDSERKQVFKNILSKYRITELSHLLEFDQTLLSDIKNGRIKPSGYIYLRLLKLVDNDFKILSLKSLATNCSSKSRLILFIS